MNTIYGRDGNVYETGIRGMNSEPFIKSELVKNELNQLEMQVENLKEQKYSELLRETQQLKDNWNKLKEYMSDENISNLFDRGYQANDFIEEIRNKMQELEQGSDSNE